MNNGRIFPGIVLRKGFSGRIQENSAVRRRVVRKKPNGFSAVTAVILAAILVSAFSIFIISSSMKSSAFTPHAPILIEGDSNFTFANGVTSGNGSQSNPYIISGWEINISAQNGIEVRNTTAYFEIQGVYIHSGVSNSNDCIHFLNVTNGYIVNSDLAYYANYALFIEDSTACVVRDSRIVGPPSGFFMPYGIYLQETTDVLISNNLFYRISTGVQLWNSDDNRIVGNNCTTVGNGIYILSSDNVTASGNDLTNVSTYGVASFSGTNVTISNNNLTINDYVGIGVYLSSSNITVTGNNITDNDIGIYSQISRDLNFSNNFVYQSEDFGILIDRTQNVTVLNNNLTSCGISIMGSILSQLDTHTISSDNQVNGLPVYYYKNLAGLDINGTPMGGLILVNCTDSNISNLQITDTDISIEMAYVNNTFVKGCNLSSNNYLSLYSWSSKNINISGNNLSGNSDYGIMIDSTASMENVTLYGNNIVSNRLNGIYVDSTNDVEIIHNRASYNGQFSIYLLFCNRGNISENNITNNSVGIYLDTSSNLKVYHNNFFNNTQHAMERNIPNTWDDGYPNGGNYWDDYTGVDNNWGPAQNIPGSDGIGDTGYDFGGFTNDTYPLMQPIPEFQDLAIPIIAILLLAILLARRRPN